MGNNSGNGHIGNGVTQPLGPNVDYTNAGYTGSTDSFAGAEKNAERNMQMPMPFTPEQYDQILKMLQKDSTPESTTNVANAAGPSHWEGEGDWKAKKRSILLASQ